jgi:hypothetical protein
MFGSLAKFTAIRRAPSRVSRLFTARAGFFKRRQRHCQPLSAAVHKTLRTTQVNSASSAFASLSGGRPYGEAVSSLRLEAPPRDPITGAARRSLYTSLTSGWPSKSQVRRRPATTTPSVPYVVQMHQTALIHQKLVRGPEFSP